MDTLAHRPPNSLCVGSRVSLHPSSCLHNLAQQLLVIARSSDRIPLSSHPRVPQGTQRSKLSGIPCRHCYVRSGTTGWLLV